MLIGTLVLLPIILGYVVFVYWLFRGKVREGETLSLSRLRRGVGRSAAGASARRRACGRIIAQPMRSSGSRPCTGRSKARGSLRHEIGEALP